MKRLFLACGMVAFAAGCGSSPTLTKDQLMDPASCATCHPDHHKQWASSMHAYAADDPVFRAMNARGQRETNHALGNFCVNCHAPMAVRAGATTDGMNLDSLPQSLHGVTCYFCHSAVAVTDTHNAPVGLAADGILRGGIADPVNNAAHHAAYSALHDRQDPKSATLCGSCHDIVSQSGVALERTYQEWQGSVYSHNAATTLRTCGKCHMNGTQGLAAQAPGVLLRTVHDHLFAAVDTALTPWPDIDVQTNAIDQLLYATLTAKLCVMPNDNGADVVVTLDNVAVGHNWPSGASQDRRGWVELVAYQGASAIYQSGQVADNQPILPAATDPTLWLLEDSMKDKAGKETHMFWDAATETGASLTPSVTNDPLDPRYFHAVTRTYKILGKQPDKVTLRVRLRPIGLEVLDDLIASKDLDPSVRARMPIFTLTSTMLEWDKANGGFGCVP